MSTAPTQQPASASRGEVAKLKPSTTAAHKLKNFFTPPSLKRSKSSSQLKQANYNFVDEELGDPFIFYNVMTFLPVASHLSIMDFGDAFLLECYSSKRLIYKRFMHNSNLLNCMLVHSRWYELLDCPLFYKILISCQFKKYFSIYVEHELNYFARKQESFGMTKSLSSQSLNPGISSNVKQLFTNFKKNVKSSSQQYSIATMDWKSVLKEIVLVPHWSPFISREKEFLFNRKRQEVEHYARWSAWTYMLHSDQNSTVPYRGGVIFERGLSICAPCERIPRLIFTYQMFRCDRPILADMIVEFQILNALDVPSECFNSCFTTQTINPSHNYVAKTDSSGLTIAEDNYILLGIVDSELLVTKGDTLMPPNVVTEPMSEQLSAKFNYLGEYNLKTCYRGRARDTDLNLGFASNGYLCYSTSYGGTFFSRWQLGDVISFEITGVNAFVRRLGTNHKERKKEFAVVTIRHNGKFVSRVEDFMLLNRPQTGDSIATFPKLYYFSSNFYFGGSCSTEPCGNVVKIKSVLYL